MLPIPENILVQFNNVLNQRELQKSSHLYYRKWLRYFLDFRTKNPPPEAKSEQVRLFECVGLRVQSFNFKDGILTVHGKGGKDRTVPLPRKLIPKLKIQLEFVSELHDKDLARGYAGVFLKGALERKYPTAAKDFIWQWFFPQRRLTPVPGTNEKRRYHLHESHVQRAITPRFSRAEAISKKPFNSL